MPTYSRTQWSGNRSSRRGQRPGWMAVHTEEGVTDRPVGAAARLVNFCQPGRSQVSYSVVVDDDETVGVVPDDSAPWCLRNGNPRSLNLVFAGSTVRWTRAQWLDRIKMLTRGAAVIREWSGEHRIPPNHIGANGVSRGADGLIEHGDYSIGARDGTHTDVGPNFPWDVFADLVANHVPVAAPAVAPPTIPGDLVFLAKTPNTGDEVFVTNGQTFRYLKAPAEMRELAAWLRSVGLPYDLRLVSKATLGVEVVA